MVPIVPVVIVPVLTEHERVDSMLTSFDGFIIDLVVIDNGNHRTWEPRTSKASNIYHYRMPTNLGVAASWNLGIKATCKSAGWMIVNHDVGFGHNGVSDFFAQASPTNLVLGGKPPWSCFWVGSDVVQKVGLFHEGYHPAYFEDNDYEVTRTTQRCGHHPFGCGYQPSELQHLCNQAPSFRCATEQPLMRTVGCLRNG
jgi:hypothetical protein